MAPQVTRAHYLGMLKRSAAALLWYAMIWVGYEILWSVAGVPRPLGPVIAAAVAMLVTVDPVHMFWPRSESANQAVTDRTVQTLEGTAFQPR
jgi:hypothetical protein